MQAEPAIGLYFKWSLVRDFIITDECFITAAQIRDHYTIVMNKYFGVLTRYFFVLNDNLALRGATDYGFRGQFKQGLHYSNILADYFGQNLFSTLRWNKFYHPSVIMILDALITFHIL